MGSFSGRIALAGSTGQIGRALTEAYPGLNWVPLSREVLWGNSQNLSRVLEGTMAVINLAGAPLARRWTKRYREEIIRSRESLNRKLVDAVRFTESPPGIFLSASAIGYYSSEGEHRENHYQEADGFLHEVVRRWEAPLEDLPAGVYGVRARIGNVLDKDGGLLVPFLKSARTGVVPLMGSGKQILSFIHKEDLVRGLMHILDKKQEGVYNLCTPYPVEFATFARTLVTYTRAFMVVRIPDMYMKWIMGASHVLVTEGRHVLPERLVRDQFEFTYPHLEDALRNLLQKH